MGTSVPRVGRSGQYRIEGGLNLTKNKKGFKNGWSGFATFRVP